MNKLLIILFSIGLAVNASAQPKIGGIVRQGTIIRGGGYRTRPNVTVIVPAYPVNTYYRYGYRPYYGYGSFGYSPLSDPFYAPRVESRPSQLDLAIDDIKEDYDYKIDSAKDDKSLSKDERKQKVRDLKHEREDAISEAKKSYYQKKDNKDQSDKDSE